MDRGCKSRVNINLVKIIIGKVKYIISENSLKKILILEIKNGSNFFSEVLKSFLSLIYKTSVFFKLLKLMNLSMFVFLAPILRTFCGLVAFVSNRKHLLRALLSLEFVILNIFWVVRLVSNRIAQEAYLTLFFLTLVACEGALGLSLLVSVVRTHGNDCFNVFRTLQC